MGRRKNDLYTTEEVIQGILEDDRQARNCDDYLYAEVIRVVNPAVLDKPLRVVLNNFNQLDIPSRESVGRIRRKLQSEKPWLMADDKVREYRTDNEELYRKYATECEVR